QRNVGGKLGGDNGRIATSEVGLAGRAKVLCLAGACPPPRGFISQENAMARRPIATLLSLIFGLSPLGLAAPAEANKGGLSGGIGKAVGSVASKLGKGSKGGSR